MKIYQNLIADWIANKKVWLWQNMQDNVTNDEKWNKARGAYDVLGELQSYILDEAKKKKIEQRNPVKE